MTGTKPTSPGDSGEVGGPPVQGRLARATAWGQARAESARLVGLEARERWRVVAMGFDLAERDRRRLGGLLAGALAYRLFLWVLPMSLFLVGVLGAVTSFDDGAPGDIVTEVGLDDFLGDALIEGAQARGWWIAIVVGFFAALYAGTGVIRALRVSHAAAWGIIPARGRKIVQGSLWLMGIAVALVIEGGLIGWITRVSGFGGLAAILATTAVYFTLWLLVSQQLPHRAESLRGLVPGAAVLAVGIQGLNLFTAYFLAARAERAASLYGTIGAALVILLWLFIIARLMVGAAILNAELAGEHDEAEEAT